MAPESIESSRPTKSNRSEIQEPFTADAGLVDRLSAHKTIGGVPPAELRWLAAHGHLRRYAAGEVVSARAAGRVLGLYIVLSGRFGLQMDRGAGRHKIAEWRAGDVTGLLPYSRMVSPPGDTVAEEPSEVLLVPHEHFTEMVRECHLLTSTLVHVMLDRARHFTSSDLQDEKLVSLGKLAAGLAHELNNPAAAIRRSAKLLPASLEAAESAARALGEAGLTETELAAIRSVRDACAQTPLSGVRSPLEHSERESAISDWLESRGVDTLASDALADTPLPIDALDRLAENVREDVLGAVLKWLGADCAARGLAFEIDQAAGRISHLVSAVKGFTQVDASVVPQPVDIRHGLVDTVAVIKAKAQRKSVAVLIDVDDRVPLVRGVAGELNQVWSNLIDNALDAVPDGGRVRVTAKPEGDAVVVSVVDDGPGIPAEIRERIFEPFFTTKDVGQGTGLGLDIVRRLVQRHDGRIDVQSDPGHTEFRVSLPAAETPPRAGGR
jgi:signal transduction histidine kinase